GVLAGAEANYGGGASDAALALLASAKAWQEEALQHAGADLLRGQIAFASRRGSDAPGLLLRAARQFEPLDPRLARDTYLDALAAATFAGRLASDGGILAVAGAPRAAPPAPGAPRPPETPPPG